MSAYVQCANAAVLHLLQPSGNTLLHRSFLLEHPFDTYSILSLNGICIAIKKMQKLPNFLRFLIVASPHRVTKNINRNLQRYILFMIQILADYTSNLHGHNLYTHTHRETHQHTTSYPTYPSLRHNSLWDPERSRGTGTLLPLTNPPKGPGKGEKTRPSCPADRARYFTIAARVDSHLGGVGWPQAWSSSPGCRTAPPVLRPPPVSSHE